MIHGRIINEHVTKDKGVDSLIGSVNGISRKVLSKYLDRKEL